MKQKLLQILYDMRTQPVIGLVTLIGTALSIFLIMTVMMMQEVKTIPFAPESNRGRIYYGLYFHQESMDGNQSRSGGMSLPRAQQLYGGLEGVEETSFFYNDLEDKNVKGLTDVLFSAKVRYTDNAFWRVFDHKLLAGRYYTPEEVSAHRSLAVVSEETARRLFGSENPVGQHFDLDYNDFEVIGVVANTSLLASMGCGDIFAPLEAASTEDPNFGGTAAALLAASGTTGEDLAGQVKARYSAADAEMAADEMRAVYHGTPFGQEIITQGWMGSNTTPDPDAGRTDRLTIYIILLIVPAINLSTMLHSRLRRRVSELGIRRAFGCTRRRIITDIVAENLIVTVAGGIIGLLLGVLFGLFYDGLFVSPAGEAVRPALSLLLNWRILVTAFGVCFILNLISASVPAWQASRLHPAEAVNSSRL